MFPVTRRKMEIDREPIRRRLTHFHDERSYPFSRYPTPGTDILTPACWIHGRGPARPEAGAMRVSPTRTAYPPFRF